MPRPHDLSPRTITVALSAYNAEKTIERAVHSLLTQTHRELSVYVVDDCSSDGTGTLVEKIIQKTRDPRLNLIRRRSNQGTYAAKNLILSKFCRSEFYAHQDADDFSWPDRLRRQIEFLRENPGAAACGTGIDEFYASPEEVPLIPSAFEPVYSPEDGYYHRKNLYDPILRKGSCFEHDINDLPKLKIAMNGSILFRTEAILSLGGFDGRSRIGADTQLLWRLLVCHDFMNLQEVLYSRLFHGSSLTRSDQFGFGSDTRRAYAQKSKEKLAAWKALRDAGDESALSAAIREDFFSGPEDYDLINIKNI